MTTTVIDIPLGDIHPSPFNHRKAFKDLDQLAESIKSRGVLQPVTVRPNQKGWELVFGERRWRAAKLAGVETIPAIERKMTDVEVLEAQLIENVQRADVHPIEEAEGYRELIDKHKYTVDQIVAKTGKSRSAIYERLELCKLATPVRKVFLEDKLNASIAVLLARIPNPKLQEQACREILGEGDHDDYRDADLTPEHVSPDDAKPHDQEYQPLSFRAAAILVRRKYQLKLALATFDPADASLLPKVGACTTCQFRSGNQPELPGLGAKADDLCTNVTCFEQKTGAQWKLAAAAAREKKMEVVDQAKAKNWFDWNSQPSYQAPVVSAEQHGPYGVVGTFGKALGKEIANVKKVLVQDPNGAPRELLDKEDALKKLRELGKLNDGKAKKSSKDKAADKVRREERAKAKEKSEIGELALRVAIGAMVVGAEKMDAKKETAFLRLVAAEMLTNLGYGADQTMVTRRGLKNLHELKALPEKAKTAGELRGVIIEALITDMQDSLLGHWAGAEDKTKFKDACKLFGVDWDKAQAAAKESLRFEKKAGEANAAKKPKKGGSK